MSRFVQSFSKILSGWYVFTSKDLDKEEIQPIADATETDCLLILVYQAFLLIIMPHFVQSLSKILSGADTYPRQRILIKKRFNLLSTQQKPTVNWFIFT